MISIQFASTIFALLVVSIGIIHWRMELKIRLIRKLEKSLTDARRELQAMEMLKSRFLGRIGDVLAEPLIAIGITSDNLGHENPGLPENVLKDLSRLSEEVHSLVRILTVFEQISKNDRADQTDDAIPAERIQLDVLVSNSAMEISDAASDRMVSVSVNICGPVEASGNPSQIAEAIGSLLQETLKRASENTVLSIELREPDNIELEINWTGERKPGTGNENLLGTGLTRLIASSHGGWVSEDWDEGRIILILPAAGDIQ